MNVCRRVEVKCKNKLARKDAPLLVLLFYRLNISVPTSSVIGVLLQILSASYYDDASTSHGQPSQPLSVSRVLLPFPLLGSPPHSIVVCWCGGGTFPSMQLMMTLLVHHRCCLLHAHNMHNYRLCACYWFQSVQFHPALGSGIAIQWEFQYLYAMECTTLLLFSTHLPFTFDAVSTSYLSYSSLKLPHLTCYIENFW